MLTLSVLDQSPVRQGVTPRDALLETIELARHCEALGYRRYWLAEHHATPALAGSAPEIMIARIAAETRHIRVGSGGVMLSHYSSLKVAEQFCRGCANALGFSHRFRHPKRRSLTPIPKPNAVLSTIIAAARSSVRPIWSSRGLKLSPRAMGSTRWWC